MLIEEELSAAAERIAVLELKVKSLEQYLGAQKFRLSNKVNDDVMQGCVLYRISILWCT